MSVQVLRDGKDFPSTYETSTGLGFASACSVSEDRCFEFAGARRRRPGRAHHPAKRLLVLFTTVRELSWHWKPGACRFSSRCQIQFLQQRRGQNRAEVHSQEPSLFRG